MFLRAAAPAFCLAVFLVPLVGSTPAHAQSNHPGLGVESIYPTVGRCGPTASGDFDGDGDNDLAVVEDDSAAISLWWNDGRAGFTGRGVAPVGHPYAAFVPIDVGGDGILDLAVADTTPAGGIEILRGVGAGAFAAPVAIAPGLRSRVLLTADLNGDNRADLVVATWSEPFRVVALLQVAPGTFVEAGAFSVGHPVTALAMADFDGDGRTDIAAGEIGDAYPSPGTMHILRGDGTGGLTEWTSFPYESGRGAPDSQRELVAADINGDGRPDLLSGWAVHDSEFRGRAWIHLQVGAAFVTTPLFSNHIEFCGGLAAADLDGNGRMEVLALQSNSYSTEWLGTDLVVIEAASDPTLRKERRYCVDYGASTVTRLIASRLDSGGTIDLVVPHDDLPRAVPRSGRVSIVRSRSAGWYSLPTKDVGIAGLVRTARFVRNGASEVVSAGPPGTYRVAVDSRGVASASRRISDAKTAWVLDADGDGLDDLALGFGGDSIGIALTGRDGESLPIQSWVIGRWLTAGNMDGDRRSEIVLARRTPNGFDEVVVAWGGPRGRYQRFSNTELLEFPLTRGYGYAINAEARGAGAEIVQYALGVPSQKLDTLTVISVPSNGPLRLLSRTILSDPGRTPSTARTREPMFADVDGDGQNELVIVRGPNADLGILYVLKRTPEGGYAYHRIFRGIGWFPQSPSLQDLDHDGDPDLVFVDSHEGTSEWTRLWVLWNDGAGGFAESWVRHLGYEGCQSPSAAIGDLDGDQIADVVVAPQCSGTPARPSAPIRVIFGEGTSRPDSPHVILRPNHDPVDVLGLRLAIRADVAVDNSLAVRGTAFVPAAGEATLDLYDLAGRRVTSHRMFADAPGEQSIRMTLPRALPKGVYWLALRQGTLRATTRVAIVR